MVNKRILLNTYLILKWHEKYKTNRTSLEQKHIEKNEIENELVTQ